MTRMAAGPNATCTSNWTTRGDALGVEKLAEKVEKLERQVETKIQLATVPTCRHHWIIQSRNGPTSKGRCKICLAEREFRNYAGDSPWERGMLASETRWDRSVPVPSEGDWLPA
jgi:hypothetical protein